MMHIWRVKEGRKGEILMENYRLKPFVTATTQSPDVLNSMEKLIRMWKQGKFILYGGVSFTFTHRPLCGRQGMATYLNDFFILFLPNFYFLKNIYGSHPFHETPTSIVSGRVSMMGSVSYYLIFTCVNFSLFSSFIFHSYELSLLFPIDQHTYKILQVAWKMMRNFLTLLLNGGGSSMRRAIKWQKCDLNKVFHLFNNEWALYFYFYWQVYIRRQKGLKLHWQQMMEKIVNFPSCIHKILALSCMPCEAFAIFYPLKLTMQSVARWMCKRGRERERGKR